MPVSHLVVTWPAVSGASGYEIVVNGKKVATAGANARSSKVQVGDAYTLVEVTDLPQRSRTEVIDFLQGEA